MTSERWAKIKSVVADALELPEQDRAEFVAGACSDDAELRREVESLLSAASDDDSLPGARQAVASATVATVSALDGSQQRALEQAVGGRYEILRMIGRGGMGAVYLARERSLDRLVALKVLRAEIIVDEFARERLGREARVIAGLMHPGIIPLHAFIESAGGVQYFVMGYARGASLADRLRERGRVPWVEAHRMLMELTDAAAYAHRHGVVHCDIKPSNILLDDESGRTMLADWGIARVVEGDSRRYTGPRFVAGTPGYMSPEQVAGKEAHARSDIYALGVVAYEMLSGRQPFSGAPAAIMREQCSTDAPEIRSIVPGLPLDFAAVVMRCLARDPEKRWKDAAELKAALVHAAERASHALPEPVRDLPSFGAYALLWAIAWSGFAAMDRHDPAERALLLLIAFLVPVGLALHVWNVGRHDLGPSQLARVAAWPPEWWGMWWPAPLRRPTDLWRRLPLVARVVRIALSAVFLLVPGLIVLRRWLETPGDGVDRSWFLVAEAAVVAVAALIVLFALGWTRREGLTVGEAVRLLFGATTGSSSWQSPRLMRLLGPEPEEGGATASARARQAPPATR